MIPKKNIGTTTSTRKSEGKRINRKLQNYPAASLEVFYLPFAKNITCSYVANSLAESTCASPVNSHVNSHFCPLLLLELEQFIYHNLSREMLTWSLILSSQLNMFGIAHYCSSLRYVCCKYGDLVWFAWLPGCHVRSLSSYTDMPSYLAFEESCRPNFSKYIFLTSFPFQILQVYHFNFLVFVPFNIILLEVLQQMN